MEGGCGAEAFGRLWGGGKESARKLPKMEVGKKINRMPFWKRSVGVCLVLHSCRVVVFD